MPGAAHEKFVTKSAGRPKPGRRPELRWGLLLAIFGLFVASVPWYRGKDEPLTLWFGMPDWVAIALLCYVGVAVLNAVAWMLTDVPDVVGEEHDADIADGPG